ncbi:MAG: flippase [Saprospiraceae bacterium]|nr:flippase [Saprospiraceae bacterium]
MSNVPQSSYWLRSGFLTLTERACGLIFAFGTAALLLRGLSKEAFAAWGVFLIVAYFVEMGRNGLVQNGLIRFFALHRHDKDDYAAISTASLTINIGFSILTNVVLWLLMAPLARTLHTPEIIDTIPVYFMTNFVMALFSHFNFVQQANFEFRGIFWSTFSYRGGLFFWILAGKLAGWPLQLPQLALAMLGGALVGTAGSWLYARPFLRHSPRIDPSWIIKLAAYGKYVLGTNLSTMFYKNIDKLTLGHLLGPAAFAVYDAAAKVTQLVETPSFSIAQIVFPRSAGRMETDGAAGIKHLYEYSVAAIMAIILPFILLVLLFAEPIVWVFAGGQYSAAADIMRLTAFFGFFMPFAVQFGTILDSTGKPDVNFAYTLLTAAINLALSYYFVERYGLFGAAFATLTTYAICFILMQRYLYKKFKINPLNVLLLLPELYKTGWNLIKTKVAAA